MFEQKPVSILHWTNTGLLLREILMLGDRCARHSAIVEVASDTDKNIEQSQASGGRMFRAHTGGKKGRPI